MNRCRWGRTGAEARGFSGWRANVLLAALYILVAPTAQAQAVRSQVINLQPGWNAVYLEVDPPEANPALLFLDRPVDIVATLGAQARPAQFVRNASVDLLGAYGWAVWYAPAREDAFLTTLYAVQGAKPYLVHATAATTLTLSGPVPPVQLAWIPDAYNFVGFSVQDPGGPTFQQFFRGSTAHQHNRIYRMVNGTWRQVLDPGAATMRSGEAFWIYCQGRSDYLGPLDVSAPSLFGLSLSSQGGGELVFRNRTDHPISFFVEHVTDPASPVPISAPVQILNEAAGGLQTVNMAFPAGNWQQSFPPLEAGKALRFPLSLRLQDMESGVRYSLLNVVSDLGTLTTISITATRDDLP